MARGGGDGDDDADGGRGLTMAVMLRVGAWVLVALPALGLAVRGALDDLGANPVEALTHTTGEWALRFLLISLAVTPLRRAFGWAHIAPLRRTFGLGAFGYALAHFGVFLSFDLAFEFRALAKEIAERPYIAVGATALLTLTPLALTSTRGWQRRLGRRWLTLHRAAYVAGVLAVVHFLWLVKADLRAPLIHAAILATLLGARLWFKYNPRQNAGRAD